MLFSEVLLSWLRYQSDFAPGSQSRVNESPQPAKLSRGILQQTHLAHSGADHPQALAEGFCEALNRRTADRPRHDHCRRLQGHRGGAADVSALAAAVPRHAGRVGQAADPAGEGERPPSERFTCRVVGQHRSTQRHPVKVVSIEECKIRNRLREISADHIRLSRRMTYRLLLRECWSVNQKRVQPLSREEGVQRPTTRKRKRARPADGSVRRHQPSIPTRCGRWISSSCPPLMAAD